MSNDAVKLALSILDADLLRLKEEVVEAEQAGADRIHVDVMDGHFVPNFSLGAQIVRSLREETRLPLEVHLMITDPDLFLEEFAEAGCDLFLVHCEGANNLHRTMQRIEALGKRVGVAINPATPVAMLEEVLPNAHQILVMTVDPGFGHQRFVQSTVAKIRRVREIIGRINPDCDLEVDGGVNEETVALAVAAGANVLVAGSAIFRSADGVRAAIERLRSGIANGER